jgi:hypothetical protein
LIHAINAINAAITRAEKTWHGRCMTQHRKGELTKMPNWEFGQWI